MAPIHTTPRRLEVFVRSLGGGGQPPKIEMVIERLEDLVDRGVIGQYTVHVVGREVRPDVARATAPGRFICDRVVAFREWADRAGVSLEPFLETRRVRSALAGEEYETLVFPTVLLAELEGDHPRSVAPCAADDRVYPVGDLLDALEEAGTAYPASSPIPEPSPPRDETPEPPPSEEDPSSGSVEQRPN